MEQYPEPAPQALTPGPIGFVGAAVELLLAPPGLPFSLVESLSARPPLRHGFLAARSSRVLVVSGPPSPGLDVCLARMTEDMPVPVPLIAGHGVAVLDVAADAGAPAGAGVTVALEAGTDDDSPSGWRRRWVRAHALAPVLAAAFANAPGHGWRSVRQARTVRPPIAARGHLEIDVADRQPGDGWRVPVAVVATLMDDPVAAGVADAATADLGPEAWTRAARHGLSDPVLAEAAKECFVAAYAALARHGAGRPVRDAVAAFTERYVLHGRSPADDVLDAVDGAAHLFDRL